MSVDRRFTFSIASRVRLASLALFALLICGQFGGRLCQAQTESSPREGTVRFGQPVIDGKLDEVWKISEVTSIDRNVAELTSIDASKAAVGKLRYLWDQQNLYLLVEVSDSHVNCAQGAAWDQDSVEFYLDRNRGQTKSYQVDDAQFRVSCLGGVSYGATTGTRIISKVSATKTGYLVEARIPWKFVEPKHGLQIGFDAQINDDAGAGRRQAVMKWNQATDASWRDTSGFGTLTLVSDTAKPKPETKPKPEPEKEADSKTETEIIGDKTVVPRVPDWAGDAIFYQIFPERFRNGDPGNDPTRESLELPILAPESWKITPWTREWYQRADWEKEMGDNFYENGIFWRRYGGDLQGVIDKLDYLAELGINTIYLNPVFYARSLHKYDGNSFHHVDPHFGPDPAGDFALMATETSDPATWHWTEADKLFLSLVQQAHARNLRVIIDGVFNHTGRDFWAFADIAKNQEKSPYLDWYTVEKFDDPKTSANEFKYACWWGVDTLPEFANNADGTDLHPKPKAYVFQSTLRWMDPNGDGDPSDGIDGWRLDVANEVPNQFWKDWNAEIRKLNPQAFTVAEIWDEAGDYLGDCGFSSTMNYYGFAFPAKGFLVDGNLSASEFAKQLQLRMETHPKNVQFALQNLMDSHDVDRLASMIVNAEHRHPYVNPGRFDYDVGERVSPRGFPAYDVSRPTEAHQKILRLTALFQMSFVGAPLIYYGTETGMDGADDPDDRMPMIWDDLEYAPRTVGPHGPLAKTQPISFDRELFEYYQKLFKIRTESEALREGDFKVVATDDGAKTIVFERRTPDQTMLIAVNRGDATAKIKLPADLWANSIDLHPVVSSSKEAATTTRIGDTVVLKIPPQTGQIWQAEKQR